MFKTREIQKVTASVRRFMRDGTKLLNQAEGAPVMLELWEWLGEKTPEAQAARRALLKNAPKALGRRLLAVFVRRGLP